MLEISENLKEQIISWRRTLHSIPEAGFNEVETGKFVEQVLVNSGYSIQNKIARTGIVGEIGQGRTVIIRAEMDGYPVAEELNVPYASTHEGLMHACGHDANMACVLGAASILSQEKLNGKVRIFMQPSSESVSEEDQKSGSNKSIEEGILENAEALLSLHIDSTIKSGSVGILVNRTDNRVEQFTITVRRNDNLDWNAMLEGAKIVQTLYEGVFKKETYNKHFRISKLTATPDRDPASEVQIKGCFENLGRDTFKFFDQLIRSSCNEVNSIGGVVQFSYDNSPIKDHFGDRAVRAATKAANNEVGEEGVKSVSRTAWSDDFFPFSSNISAALIFLGVKGPGAPSILHTSTFDFDESNLYIASKILADATMEILNTPV